MYLYSLCGLLSGGYLIWPSSSLVICREIIKIPAPSGSQEGNLVQPFRTILVLKALTRHSVYLYRKHLCHLLRGLLTIVKLQGDNLVTATLTGPGMVFIQSLPFQRLSQRIAR